MAQAETADDWYVNGDTTFDPVVEVWESYSGDLWFITDPNGATGFGYARLAAMPQFAEWGTINRQELQDNSMVWQVSRSNWSNINTYEDDLLVEISE